jgi:hypothetical protein
LLAPKRASTLAVQAVGLDRCQQNTGRAQNIPSYPDFFEPPSVLPEHFLDRQILLPPNPARGI